MRVDDVLALLQPEHFVSGQVPSRSTVSERLAGVGLKQDFIEAIADLCSHDATGRERLMGQVGALQVAAAQQSAEPAGGPHSDDSVLAAELVLVQQRSLAVSDKLMRALERSTALELERNSANQMVLLLLAMVDKLQRDIATLTRERDRFHVSASGQMATDVRARLLRSEQQRTDAEAELDRARAERHKADRLAEEAAEQVRALTEELDRLRGQPRGAEEPPLSAESLPVLTDTLATDGDDIDQALAKAARHLDDGASRLDRLAAELHQEDLLDNSPDNAVASTNLSDISSATLQDAGLDSRNVVEIIRTARQTGGEHTDVPAILLEAAREQPCDTVLDLAELLRESGYDEEADQLLGFAGESWPLDGVPAIIGSLRTAERHSDAYQLLTSVGRQRSAFDVREVTAALRSTGHNADAYQVLTAVGRSRPTPGVIEVLNALYLLDDVDWILDAAARDRGLAQLSQLIDALRAASRNTEAGRLSAAYKQRVEASAQAARALASASQPAKRITDSGGQVEADDLEEEDGESQESTFFRSYEIPQLPAPREHSDVPFVRPYAYRHQQASRVDLPVESMVSTVAVAIVGRTLLPQHERICSLCHEPQSITQISHRLAVPLGVALLFVADLAAMGLVTIDPPPGAVENMESPPPGKSG
ncbi:DUF742 domain-containing protein [Streptomyces sp. NPDC056132]|uniref:DUF742 domain-containing protein n=1 Tax=Streptomyces sp. NPDC056132 TaxID=3345722 RepID=UPI0035E27E21